VNEVTILRIIVDYLENGEEMTANPKTYGREILSATSHLRGIWRLHVFQLAVMIMT
jgi:hypothetical protein